MDGVWFNPEWLTGRASIDRVGDGDGAGDRRNLDLTGSMSLVSVSV